MEARAETADLWSDLARHGIAVDGFDFQGRQAVDCPYCGASHSLQVSRRTQRVRCEQCKVDSSLRAFVDRLDALADAGAGDDEVTEARDMGDDFPVDAALDMVAGPVISVRDVERVEQRRQVAAELALAREAARAEKRGRLVERVIMTLLALVFLACGLAAAGLSGFANYQAFSQSVGDPLQGQIWGWSGVIASVCSFGGFTFFWWHLSAKRYSEGVRSLLFALAGAATSLAGTAMYMDNNTSAQDAAQLEAGRARAVIENQVADWTRQLEGIPASTRSIAGLEAYLAGVEAAGRTHQKPYRDAQNELGLARRRAALEDQLAGARAQLLGRDETVTVTAGPERKTLPAWFFALMLEVFSSQGTSIAFVSLLLLYSARGQHPSRSPRPGPDS